MPRNLLPATLLAALFVAGCGSGPEVRLENARGFQLMPDGPAAVLRVDTSSVASTGGYQFVYGSVHSPNARRGFAELLGHSAEEVGGVETIPPHEVEKKLKAAGRDPGLTPSVNRLDDRARIAGCALYFTAEIQQWHYSYFLMRQKGVAEFTVTCRRSGDEAPLWRAHVLHERKGMTERELAAEALRVMFQRLRWRPEG